MGVMLISKSDLCHHCGKMRKFHQPDTKACPVGKMKNGYYAEFGETVFKKALPESAIDKFKIKVDQVYLSADGALHGLIVKDLHRDPAGDYCTVQRVTPQGKDGPLTRVHAYTMSQQTHYEAERPPWWPKAALRRK